MQIVVFEAEADDEVIFQPLRARNELIFVAPALRPDNAGDFAAAEIVSTFIYSKLGADTLARLPRLKMIATRSTGFDHIDLDYCRAHGIAVANVPTYGENTVAEHVFALLLAISHRLPEAIARARAGRIFPEGLQGFDLEGKTLGVIGTGNIGRHVIRIAHGFGMPVLAFDLRPDPDYAQSAGFRYVALHDLLAAADILTLHVPASAKTDNLIDAAAIARMKPGAVIINTARGSVIEAGALVAALRSGKIAAAGLDVLPGEPLIREEAELLNSRFIEQHDLRTLVADHVLLGLPNVVVTPHSAFNTREAVRRIVVTTVENIGGFIAGTPHNRVR